MATRALPSLVPDIAGGEIDRLFQQPAPAGDFQFNPQTAAVFGDMVDRSVPFYAELQRMSGEIAADFAQPGTNLYDLGCATGTTLELLDGTVHPEVRFVGMDNSPAMLEKARAKLAALGSSRNIDFVEADLHALPAMADVSVTVMNLTLQFVRPLHRERLARRIFDATRHAGCLVLVEKLLVRDSRLNRLYIDYYYDLKRRNGYSEIEIAQKREALENVLIPYRLEENVELLENVGFGTVEVFFRWYNFCGIVAVR